MLPLFHVPIGRVNNCWHSLHIYTRCLYLQFHLRLKTALQYKQISSILERTKELKGLETTGGYAATSDRKGHYHLNTGLHFVSTFPSRKTRKFWEETQNPLFMEPTYFWKATLSKGMKDVLGSVNDTKLFNQRQNFLSSSEDPDLVYKPERRNLDF